MIFQSCRTGLVLFLTSVPLSQMPDIYGAVFFLSLTLYYKQLHINEGLSFSILHAAVGSFDRSSFWSLPSVNRVTNQSLSFCLSHTAWDLMLGSLLSLLPYSHFCFKILIYNSKYSGISIHWYWIDRAFSSEGHNMSTSYILWERSGQKKSPVSQQSHPSVTSQQQSQLQAGKICFSQGTARRICYYRNR